MTAPLYLTNVPCYFTIYYHNGVISYNAFWEVLSHVPEVSGAYGAHRRIVELAGLVAYQDTAYTLTIGSDIHVFDDRGEFCGVVTGTS